MFNEIHFQTLQNPTNIYGSCIIIHRGRSYLLVSVRDKVQCISYLENSTKETSFNINNIQTNNEIINNGKWINSPIILPNIPSKIFYK